jgi:hypothetical protein
MLTDHVVVRKPEWKPLIELVKWISVGGWETSQSSTF